MLLYKTAYFQGIKKNKTGIKKIKWKNYKKRKDVGTVTDGITIG